MKQIQVSIPDSCSEDWSLFQVREEGRLCQSCNKVVVDLTTMTDEEIARFLAQRTGTLCGRLRSDQLKIYSLETSVPVRPGFKLFKAGLVGLLLLLLARPAVGTPGPSPRSITQVYIHPSEPLQQEYRVRGRVLSKEDGTPLPGVNILLKGTTNGTVSDTDGDFALDIPVTERDTLVISFIGYVPIEQAVTPDHGAFEFRLEVDPRQLIEVVVVAGMMSLNEVPSKTTPDSGVESRKRSRLGNWLRKLTGSKN